MQQVPDARHQVFPEPSDEVVRIPGLPDMYGYEYHPAEVCQYECSQSNVYLTPNY